MDPRLQPRLHIAITSQHAPRLLLACEDRHSERQTTKRTAPDKHRPRCKGGRERLPYTKEASQTRYPHEAPRLRAESLRNLLSLIIFTRTNARIHDEGFFDWWRDVLPCVLRGTPSPT